MSEFRRRLMMAGKGGEPTPSNPYVTDGLVFWLDGIDKGSKSGYWTDLIGGFDFAFVSGVTSSTDGVVFANPHSWMYHNPIAEKLTTLFQDATVEVVCTYQQAQSFPWCSSYADGTCFCFNNGNIGINHTTRIQQYVAPDFAKDSLPHTYSITALDGYCDMEQLTTGNTTYFGTNNGSCIGSRWNTAMYYGTIKSIRIYSRQLTYAERLANAKADNDRFNLGLTL